jgi:hypothetical protein
VRLSYRLRGKGRFRCLLAATLALRVACFSQTPTAEPAMTPAEAVKLLSFEDEHTGALPNGWSGGFSGTVAVDDKVVHGGKWSVRLERNSESAQRSSTISKSFPINFSGSRIELRGYLRTADVSGYAGLWMRQDGDTRCWLSMT